MDRVKDTLEEVYLNMDTIEMLKEQDCDMDEIVSMFSETAEYPPELTESLANTKKSLIKSLLLRIQFYLTKKNLDADAIKSNLQAVNKNYGLIVGKLLEGLNGDVSLEASPEEVVKSESSHKNKQKKEKKEKPPKVKTPESVASEASEGEVEEDSPVKPKTQQKEVSDLDEEASVNSEEDDEKDNEEEEEEDKLEKYVKECLEKTEDDEDHLKLSDIYKDFKTWYAKNYDDEVPSRKDLKNYLVEKLGKQENSGWSNYTFAKVDDSDSD